MQYTDSDLQNLVPLWQRELPNRVDKPIRQSFVRRNAHILRAAVGQNGVGDVGPLAQDVFGALVVRQGAVKRASTKVRLDCAN